MIERIEQIEEQVNKLGPEGYKKLYQEIQEQQPLLISFFLGYKMDGYDNYLQGVIMRGVFTIYLFYRDEPFFQNTKLGYKEFQELRDEQFDFMEFMESHPTMIQDKELTQKMINALPDLTLYQYLIKGFEISPAFNTLPVEDKGTIGLEFKILLELIQRKK